MKKALTYAWYAIKIVVYAVSVIGSAIGVYIGSYKFFTWLYEKLFENN